MPEDEIAQKIIGLPETIFIILLVGFEELIEAVILLFTLGLGIIVVEVMNGGMFALIEMYMLLRGGRGVMRLIVEPIGTAINGFSGGVLPGKTVATGCGIWIINHPEKIEKALGMVGKVTGQVVQIAATAASGAVGTTVTRVAGSKVVGAVAEKTAEAGAATARQRMTMATRGVSAKVIGAERMQRERVRAQQASQQIEEIPDTYQKAA